MDFEVVIKVVNGKVAGLRGPGGHDAKALMVKVLRQALVAVEQMKEVQQPVLDTNLSQLDGLNLYQPLGFPQRGAG